MDKKPTIRDVASRAGVSPSTVSRVLNEHATTYMRSETRDRVLEAIRELRYTPARSAQRLRSRRRDIIGILVPDISNPYFSLLARGVESIAFEEGYSTLICDSNHSTEKESRYLDLLMAEQVDGIIFVPVGVPDWPRIDRLRDQGVTIVASDRCVDGILGVEAANERGSLQLTEYALSLGYTQIAYIGGPEGVQTTQDRVRGFLKAMDEAGLAPAAIEYGTYTYDSGFSLAQRLLGEASIDLIMGGDDLVALGAVHAAEQLGRSVPHDLGVTGFDAVPLLSMIRPTLTSVRIPVFDIGKESMSMLVRHLDMPASNGERKVLDVDLVFGASCPSKGQDAVRSDEPPTRGAADQGGG